MKKRGRKASAAPADAAAKILGVTPVGEREKARSLHHLVYVLATSAAYATLDRT